MPYVNEHQQKICYLQIIFLITINSLFKRTYQYVISSTEVVLYSKIKHNHIFFVQNSKAELMYLLIQTAST